MSRGSWGLRREEAFGETFLVEARIETITAALYSRDLSLPSWYHTMTPCRGDRPTGPRSLVCDGHSALSSSQAALKSLRKFLVWGHAELATRLR